MLKVLQVKRIRFVNTKDALADMASPDERARWLYGIGMGNDYEGKARTEWQLQIELWWEMFKSLCASLVCDVLGHKIHEEESDAENGYVAHYCERCHRDWSGYW